VVLDILNNSQEKNMKTKKQMNRRGFLRAAGLIAAGTVAGTSVAKKLSSKESKKTSPEEKTKSKQAPKKLQLNKLGNTDLVLSAVSIGTGSGPPTQVIKYAIKSGINFIHTCRGYAGGKAIKKVEEAIKGQRDKVILGLKITWAPDDDKAMDNALKILGVDSVDIAFFNIHKAGDVKKDKYRKGAERWIKAGKFKYIGLTTHNEMKECMENALKQGFYNALMPSYNLTMEKECEKVFADAEKQGVGIVLMKTKREMNEKNYLLAIPKYLSDPAVTTINKTLKSFADVNQIIAASEKKLNKEQEKEIKKIALMGMTGHCSMCGTCSKKCPQDVPVADMMRCADYYMADNEYYEVARETYAQIDSSKCIDCGKCEQACPNEVPIKQYKNKLKKLFA